MSIRAKHPTFAGDIHIKGSNSGRLTVLRSIAGACGIGSQVVALISLLAAISTSPWFSWTENYLSVLGVNGSATTVFNFGLILTGLLSFIFAIGLEKTFLSGRLLGRLGIISLVLGSAALSAMGIFPRTTGIPHNCASLAFFVFISLAIFLIGIMIITSHKIWGVLSLTVVILIGVFQLVPWPWSGGAIPQVLSGLPWSLWTIALGVRLLMVSKPVSVLNQGA